MSFSFIILSNESTCNCDINSWFRCMSSLAVTLFASVGVCFWCEMFSVAVSLVLHCVLLILFPFEITGNYILSIKTSITSNGWTVSYSLLICAYFFPLQFIVNDFIVSLILHFLINWLIFPYSRTYIHSNFFFD